MKKLVALVVTIVMSKLLKSEPVKKSDSLEDSLKELVRVLDENNRPVRWTPIKLLIISSVITLGTSYFITMCSVNKVVSLTEKSNEQQEKSVVLKLLKIAELDLRETFDYIERIRNAQTNTDDIEGCVIPFGSLPNAILPYPMIFTDVMTDKRVIISLSNANLKILYPHEKELNKYVEEIMIMGYNSPHKEVNYANYSNKLKSLQLTLIEEIKYQKGELSEEQTGKANSDFESKASKVSPFKRLVFH